jgi:hypothetical protein
MRLLGWYLAEGSPSLEHFAEIATSLATLEDLQTMKAILEKYSPAELGESRELRAG